MTVDEQAIDRWAALSLEHADTINAARYALLSTSMEWERVCKGARCGCEACEALHGAAAAMAILVETLMEESGLTAADLESIAHESQRAALAALAMEAPSNAQEDER